MRPTTFPVFVSSKVRLWSVSPVTQTVEPSGCRRTPSGSLPTGTVSRTFPLATSTIEALLASSFDTKSVAPSGVMSNVSGSEPPGSTRVTLRLATSTTATPSLLLSALSFSHSSSGMVGGHLGDPLNATKTILPSGETRTPRGRVPTGIVATALSVRVSMTVSSCESSLVTYASSPTGRSSTESVLVAAVSPPATCRPSLHAPPSTTSAPVTPRSATVLSRSIEDRLICVSSLVQPHDLIPSGDPAEDCAVDVCLGEFSSCQVGPGQIGLDQLRIPKIGVRQTSSGEVRMREIRLEQISAGEIGSSEIGTHEGRSHDAHRLIPGVRADIGISQVCSPQLRRSQVSYDSRARQLCPTQIR